MDDTPNSERVRLNHRSGTFIEMQPNGDEVHKVYGNGFEITVQNKNVTIMGVCNITIHGDSNMRVLGNRTEQVIGDYTLDVGGNMYVRARGTNGMSLYSDNDMTISANPNYGGTMNLTAADNVYVASSLQVAGSISADMVNVESRVNAGLGVYAGAFGVNSVGPIFSAVSVQAPLATFGLANIGIMDAVMMTDVINSGIYNLHVHPAPHGVTGPPATQFFGV
jgi:hypothetical protein